MMNRSAFLVSVILMGSANGIVFAQPAAPTPPNSGPSIEQPVPTPALPAVVPAPRVISIQAHDTDHRASLPVTLTANFDRLTRVTTQFLGLARFARLSLLAELELNNPTDTDYRCIGFVEFCYEESGVTLTSATIDPFQVQNNDQDVTINAMRILRFEERINAHDRVSPSLVEGRLERLPDSQITQAGGNVRFVPTPRRPETQGIEIFNGMVPTVPRSQVRGSAFHLRAGTAIEAGEFFDRYRFTCEAIQPAAPQSSN